jgi:hypothetical protein
VSEIFRDEEAIAWPSYVDFLFAFVFILVLALGYMTFALVHGVEAEDLENEASGVGQALKALSVDTHIDLDRRTIEIPLSRIISFEEGCPGKPNCNSLNDEQKHKLIAIWKVIVENNPNAHTIFLRGQASATQGKDAFTNFEVGNRRALTVYQILYNCGAECGFDLNNYEFKKIQLANAGATLVTGPTVNADDRTVTIILDYSASAQ